MLTIRLLPLLVLVGTALIISRARADEQMIPLAESGTWMAFAHKPSIIEAPDMCGAVESTKHFILRADTSDTEIRISNDAWSLPADVTGNIEVKVGTIDDTFAITYNTDTVVGATVSPDQLVPLLDAIAQETFLTVIAGKAPLIRVPLGGSATALNAFRTCSGISGSAKGGGSNPFQ